MQLGLKDFKRFEKQIILKNVGIAGQKKILNAKVLIIGIGGLGCPLLTYLAASGVGTIGIADPDKVEISNLNRQTLFTTNDIGKYKVDQAKSSINRVNNKIRIKIFKKKVTSKNIKSIIKDFDIICDGTDNFETRYLVNDECKKMKKILNAKVLIIGIGGLGCPLLTYLAASGVGTIGIADPDKVEISNLNRQTLFSTDDIGKYKVDQAKLSINLSLIHI